MTLAMESDRVRLIPAEMDPKKVDQIVGWLNNKEHMQFSEQRHTEHSYSSVKYYRQDHDQVDSLLWDIHAANEFIGTLTAYIDQPNKRADMGILIGPEFADTGYGGEAWKLAMRYLQTRADVITAGMMLDNIAMRRICERSGMEAAGFILDYFVYDNKRQGCLFYRWKR